MTFDIIKSGVVSALLTALIVLVAQAATYTFGVTGTATSGGGGGGALPGSMLPAHPGGGNWTVAFDDEFNGSSLDTTKWKVYPDGTAIGFACNTNDSLITESGGIATLPGGNGAACGGKAGSYIETNTPNTGHFGPGYFEARIKMDSDGQSFGAFWTSDGWGNTFADAVEIDFFENFGCSASGGLVYAPGGNRTPVNMVQYNNITPVCGFHVWGLQYVANGPLIYFLDGVEMARTGPGNPNGNMGTNADFGVVLDNASSGAGTSTDPYQIDWARVYK